MQAEIGIGSRIIVPGGEGVVTGLAEDGCLLIVALDDGDVVECDVTLALLAEAPLPRRPSDEDGARAIRTADARDGNGDHADTDPRQAFARRQRNLLSAGRACLGDIVDTLEALSGEDNVGVVLMIRVGDADLRDRGAVVLSNLDAGEVRLTMANGLEAARLQQEQEAGTDED